MASSHSQSQTPSYINVSYTAPVNPDTHSTTTSSSSSAAPVPVLTASQVWRGLEMKVRDPRDFVKPIVRCEVTEETDLSPTLRRTVREVEMLVRMGPPPPERKQEGGGDGRGNVSGEAQGEARGSNSLTEQGGGAGEAGRGGQGGGSTIEEGEHKKPETRVEVEVIHSHRPTWIEFVQQGSGSRIGNLLSHGPGPGGNGEGGEDQLFLTFDFGWVVGEAGGKGDVDEEESLERLRVENRKLVKMAVLETINVIRRKVQEGTIQ